MARPLNVLLLTNLYPNAVQVRHGVFLRERLRYLVRHPGLRFTVIAPVPWWPLRSRLFGNYAKFAGVPRRESDFGIDVFHPRYVVVPKIGDAIAPLTFAAAARRCIARHDLGRFDVIDAHFVFPDGAAAVWLGRKLACPVSVTARGSDINLMTREFFASRWIRWCLGHCDASVGVSAALTKRMLEMGADPARLHVVPNGVDGEKFAPGDRHAIRKQRGLQGPLLLSVGNLVESKGHHLAIEALRDLPDARLVIIGDGPMRPKLERLVRSLGLAERVTLLGELQQDQVVDYYNAADLLVLASANEGMPNVVLEAMSCGTPVIATAAGGLAEFMQNTQTTTLLAERNAAALARAVSLVLADPPPREVVRAEVAGRDWTTTSNAICDLLRAVAGPDNRSAGCKHAA